MTFYSLKKYLLLLTTFLIFSSVLANKIYAGYRIDNANEIKFIIEDDVTETFYSKVKELFFVFNVFSNYTDYLKQTKPVVYIWSSPDKMKIEPEGENNYILYEHPNLFSMRESHAGDQNLISMVDDYLYNKDRDIISSFLSRLTPVNKRLFLLYVNDKKTGRKIGETPEQPNKFVLLTEPLKLFVQFSVNEAIRSNTLYEDQIFENMLLEKISEELKPSSVSDLFDGIDGKEKIVNLGVFYMVARLNLIPEVLEYLRCIEAPVHVLHNLEMWKKISPQKEYRSSVLECILNTENLIDNEKTTMNPFIEIFK